MRLSALLFFAISLFVGTPSGADNQCFNDIFKLPEKAAEEAPRWSGPLPLLALPPRFTPYYLNSEPSARGPIEAGLDHRRFEDLADPEVMGRQRSCKWCWAASLQMALNYLGIKISQQELVSIKFGAPVDEIGNIMDIIEVVNKVRNSHNIDVRTASLKFNEPALIVKFMTSEFPLLLFLTLPNVPIGHFVVIEKITYRLEGTKPVIVSAVIRESSPNFPTSRDVSWQWVMERSGVPGVLGVYIN